jgi:hypothetical protein
MSFDKISSVPIETNATVRLCLNYKEGISEDFENVKFKKIPFVDGVI